MAKPSTVSLLNCKLYPQWIAATGVVQLLIQLGVMCTWSSPFLAQLTMPDSPIFLTLNEASWVASLLNMGRFIGAIIGALCVHYWGSKNAIVCTLLPMICSWILLFLANSPILLYVARFSGGLGLGMTFSCFPLYLGEIALPQIRGAMVTLAFCGSPFGYVLVSLVGYYMSMKMSSLVFLVLCLINIGMFMLLPDSPHYLMKIGKLEAARKSIHWYRSGVDVDEEFEAVQKFVTASAVSSLQEKLNEFKNPPIRRALFIIIMLFTFTQICGLNSLMFYMEMVFRRAKSDLIDPSLAVILINASGLLTAILSVKMMDKCGRKILLMISGTGISISMIALGTHFILMDLGFDPTKFQWLPVASAFLFMITFVFGLMPTPSAVLSELFPANIKCIAACIASFTGALFAFASTKTWQPTIDALGEAYVFYIQAALTSLLVPFVWYFMPETKGKTLQQIQDDLMT